MTTARLSTKGQIVIPRDVRERLDLKPGDDVEFTLHAGHAHLEKADGKALAAFLAGPKARWRKEELHDILERQYA